jgi:hypothetical protein
MQNEMPTVSTARSPWYAPFASAVAPIDAPTWIALGATVIGWFLLDTLRIEWGPIDRRVPFYDLAVIIGSPVRLLTGVDGHRGFSTALFVTLCCVTLLTPLLPSFWRSRFAWLTWIAPFAVMLSAALLLHSRTSNDSFPAGVGFSDTIANDLRHLTNHIFHHARESVARKVTLAAGGYVASIGTLYLAVRGIRGFRAFRNGSKEAR